MESDDGEKFGKRLREIREGCLIRTGPKLSQRALAALVGKSQTYISQLETSGRWHGKFPPLDDVRRLADALGVTVDELSGTEPLPPPVRQIAEPPVSYAPAQLQELGRVLVQVVEQQRAPLVARPATDTRRLPIVNAIAANEAMDHGQQTEDYVEVPAWMLNGARDPIVFRVVGECLRDLGIFGTDLLVVDRANREPRQGDIVAARINGEATAKCFYRVGDHIELRPAASGFETITVNGKDQLEILGVYVTYLPVAKRV